MNTPIWKSVALDYVPEIEPYLDDWDQPAGLWIELQGLMDRSINTSNSELSKRIIEYLFWCVSGEAGDVGSDVQQAVYCLPLEDWGRDRKYWPFLPLWFTQSQFDDFFDCFSYGLSDNDADELKEYFKRLAASLKTPPFGAF